jgi:hypothetical protein
MAEVLAFHNSLAQQLRDVYPNLHLVPPFTAQHATVRGTLAIAHDGREVDSFSLEVQVPSEFPRCWPRIWEVGGRIPRTLERHVYPSDGSLCILLPEEAYFTLPRTLTVTQYLDGPVRNYLIGQCSVEVGRGWPWGERSHGIQGIEEFYQEILGTPDRITIATFIVLILEGRFKGHWPCPCGSGKPIRRCHKDVIYSIKERIPQAVLIRYLNMVAEEIKKS